jgi:S-adenosylmethionine decarboxylase proenzyme
MTTPIVSSGKHMICDLKNIQNMSALHSLEKLQHVLDTICETHDYHVLARSHHAFDPQGHTLRYLLSESHLSIHTFPEKKYAAIDIYTCRDYPDDGVYEQIYDYLVTQFDCDREKPIIVLRG